MLNSNDTINHNLITTYVLIVSGKVKFSATSLSNIAFVITSDCMDADIGSLKKSANNIYNHAFEFVIDNNISILEDMLGEKNIAIFGDIIIVKSFRNQGVA